MGDALDSDIDTLCLTALDRGTAAFTYATCLRVTLAYQQASWGLVVSAFPDSGGLSAVLGEPENLASNAKFLASLIEARLGAGLAFGAAKPAELGPQAGSGIRACVLRGSGGPVPDQQIRIDAGALERLARYARRDGRGTVTSGGWTLVLERAGWVLTAQCVGASDQIHQHHRLGFMVGALERLLGTTITLRKAEH